MMSRPTIFAEVVLRRCGRPEDAASDGLVFLLSASRLVRQAFQEYVQRVSGLTLPELVRFEAQIEQQLGGRPDIVAWTADGRQALFIENKFWAGLTENQPVAYLKSLMTHRGDNDAAALVFVCPDRAAAMYSNELRRRIDDTDLGHPQVVETQPLVCRFGDRMALLITTWRRLLDTVAQAAADADDRQLVEDTTQLRGLIEQVDAEQAFLPLRSVELGAEFGRRWREFEQIQWQLVTVLTSQPYGMGYRQNSLTVGLGGPGKWEVWIGRELELWARYGHTPFWLVVNRRQPHYGFVKGALHSWLATEPADALEVKLWSTDCLCIPLVPQLGVAKDRVLQDLAAQVVKVRQALLGAEESTAAAVSENEVSPAPDGDSSCTQEELHQGSEPNLSL